MPRVPFTLLACSLLALAPLHAQQALGKPKPKPEAARPAAPKITVPELTELRTATDSDALLVLVAAADARVAEISDPAERALTRETLDKISAKPNNFEAILEGHHAKLKEIRNKIPETIFLTGLARCKTDDEVVRFARETYPYAERLEDASLRRTVRFTLAKLEDKPGDAPAILKEHLKAVGSRFYLASKASYDANDAQGALESIQIAIRSDPENVPARFLFAHILNGVMGDTPSAIRTLRFGLQYLTPGAPDTSKYLDRYFQLLESREGDAEVISECSTLLTKEGFEPVTREMLAMHLASALCYTSRSKDALAVIEKTKLTERVQGVLLQARCLFDARQTEAATHALESSSSRFRGAERDAVLSQLQRFWTELGRDSLALNVAEQRIREFPDKPSPRVHRLWIYQRTGDTRQFGVESEAILNQYGMDQGAIVGVANLAADRGLSNLAQRCFQKAVQFNFNRPLFALLVLEAHVNAKEYRDAIANYENFVKMDKDLFKGQEASVNALLAAADAGVGDAASKDESARRLKAFLDAKGLQPISYISTARMMRRAGDIPAALAILEKGRAVHEWNNQIRADLLSIRFLAGKTDPVKDKPAVDEELFAIVGGRRVDPRLWDSVGFWLQNEANLPADRLSKVKALADAMARPDLAKDAVRD